MVEQTSVSTSSSDEEDHDNVMTSSDNYSDSDDVDIWEDSAPIDESETHQDEAGKEEDKEGSAKAERTPTAFQTATPTRSGKEGVQRTALAGESRTSYQESQLLQAIQDRKPVEDAVSSAFASSVGANVGLGQTGSSTSPYGVLSPYREKIDPSAPTVADLREALPAALVDAFADELWEENDADMTFEGGGTFSAKAAKKRMTRVIMAARQTRLPIAREENSGSADSLPGSTSTASGVPLSNSAPPPTTRTTAVPPLPAARGSTNGVLARANKNVNMMYSDRETEMLKEILSFIVYHQPDLLQEFFAVADVNADEMCDTLISLSFVTACPMKMIRYFIENEFQTNHQEEGSIMRANCLASKIVKAYLKRVGGRYLHAMLSGFVNSIVVTDRKISYEIDPSVVSDAETLELHKQLLISKASIIVERFTARLAIDRMPVGIRVIAGFVADCAQRYAPKAVYKLVGGFVVLRYLNPAIFSPDASGICEKPPSQNSRRNLTLLSKILQNLANGVQFGRKEGYMTALNDFLIGKQAIIERYFDDVVAPSTTRVPVASDLQVVTTKDLHDVHRVLFEAKDQLVAKITKPADRVEFTKLLDKLGTYQAKISFSYLAISDRKNAMALLAERGEEASFINWVDKTKRKKVQKRLLIVGVNRIFTLKPNGRVAREGHILDLRKIESVDSKKFQLVFSNFTISANTQNDISDQIINSIRRAWAITFSHLPASLGFRVRVKPRTRLEELPVVEAGACGNFTQTYRSLADYYKQRFHEELCWDIENIFASDRTFDLGRYLTEFEDPLTQADCIPLLHTLRHNTWFETLEITDYKFDPKGMAAIAEVMSANSSLKKLVMARISADKAGWIQVFDAMSKNSNCQVYHLDLRDSALEDKPTGHLTAYLRKALTPIRYLNISGIGCSSKALVQLFGALEANAGHSKFITTLAVSNNKFGPEGSSTMWQFLSKEVKEGGSLRELRMANAQPNIKIVIDGLQGGFIETLDLSQNKVQRLEDQAALTTYLHQMHLQAGTLRVLRLQSCSMPAAVAEKVLASVHPDLRLAVDLSGNSFGVAGAAAFAKMAYRLQVAELSLADTDLTEDGVAELCLGLRNNSTITRLDVSRNFKGKSSKGRNRMVENLVKLIDSESAIEALIITATPKKDGLKGDIIPLLSALGGNRSLTELDISGHSFGNRGAVALAKSMQTNETLVRLTWDDNSTGMLGFRNMKSALKINTTLKYMPLPINDVADTLQHEASAPDSRIELTKIVSKMESHLRQNQLATQ